MTNKNLKNQHQFVHIRQYNPVFAMDGIRMELISKGGITLAIDLPNKVFRYARCYTEDNYCKQEGREECFKEHESGSRVVAFNDIYDIHKFVMKLAKRSKLMYIDAYNRAFHAIYMALTMPEKNK